MRRWIDQCVCSWLSPRTLKYKTKGISSVPPPTPGSVTICLVCLWVFRHFSFCFSMPLLWNVQIYDLSLYTILYILAYAWTDLSLKWVHFTCKVSIFKQNLKGEEAAPKWVIEVDGWFHIYVSREANIQSLSTHTVHIFWPHFVIAALSEMPSTYAYKELIHTYEEKRDR